MRRRLHHLLILLACAASAAPAAAQSRQVDVPEGMHYAASVRGTTYYAVTSEFRNTGIVTGWRRDYF